jgi:hypothetical protein
MTDSSSTTSRRPTAVQPFDRALVIEDLRRESRPGTPRWAVGPESPARERARTEPELNRRRTPRPIPPAQIARQLANLSPGGQGVAAAASHTQEERGRAAEVDETEDPINRELLLKFLGSSTLIR